MHLTVPLAPRAPRSLGRVVHWLWAVGERCELTADVEDPCPLSVIAGGVEDESVVIEEGSGALGPQDHDGHVFQVCGDREFRERAWHTVGAQIMLASPAPLEGEEGESLFPEFHPGGMHGTAEAARGTCQVGRTVKVCLGAGLWPQALPSGPCLWVGIPTN